jgi:hypothetical protein
LAVAPSGALPTLSTSDDGTVKAGHCEVCFLDRKGLEQKLETLANLSLA